MTVGERIRYFRKQLGITQEELARRAELHPVSVRKYETNKMVPQYDQLKKLAEALDVNPSAISGVDRARYRLRTVGDLMGLMIVLCDSEVLRIVGVRESDGLIKKESAQIQFNSKLSPVFLAECIGEVEHKTMPLIEVSLKIKEEKILDWLLAWEKERYLYRCYSMELVNKPSAELLEKRDNAIIRKEYAELELQKSKEELVYPDGLKGEIWAP